MNTDKVLYPLSESQKSIWYLEKAYPGTSLNIVAGNLRLRGEICYPALEQALNIFVKKNDSMRLRIVEEDGTAWQYVTDYEESRVDFIDFSKSGGLKELFSWDEELTRTPLNIINSPLFYSALYKVSDVEGGMYLKMHHLISDAWTMGLFTRQIIDIYSKIKKGETIDESPNPSYLEHLLANEEYVKSDRFIKDKAYWNRKFETLPEMTILKPHKSSENTICAKRKTLITPIKLSNKIREFCAANNLSPFTLFMSALSIYINRVTGIEDIVLGTTILNRTNTREKETAGMFVSVAAPVRVSINDTMDFKTFAKEMLKENTNVLRHQKYPYNYLISDLKKIHKFSDRLFDIVLSYQNSKLHKNETEEDYVGKWLFSGYQVESLVISINDREDGGNLIIDYDFLANAFNIKEIEFIHQHIISLLWHALDNPARQISKLEMISERERRTILHEFNNTYVDYPRDKTIKQLFEEQAAKTPDSIALIFKDCEMTYAQLNKKANALAHKLRSEGVGPGKFVGLMSNHSPELIVGILGILKACGVYLPIDPDYPAERKAYMLEDSGVEILLTKQEFFKDIPFNGTMVDLCGIDDTACLTNPDTIGKPSDLAYIIYTSGSTGKPKGTLIPQNAVVNYCHYDMRNIYGHVITEDIKRIVSVTTVSFDIFVTESLLPLLNGMSVILADEREQNQQDKLNALIVKHQAEVIQTTPSKMNLLISDNDNLEYLKVLKVIILGGEPLTQAFLQRLRSKTSARIFNAYGPTETTVWSSVSDLDSDFITIGRPLANTQIYILDRNRNLLPIGIPGDIYIAGEGLSAGYYKNSTLTDDKFIFNHLTNFGRMYKTGDVGYWKSKGEIIYLGRNDFQIKLRGMRIELGEIEAHLSAHGTVKSSIVKGITKDGNMSYLCAYVIVENGFNVDQVREYLHQRLPEYMVPSCFIVMDDFPMTANGKIDRKALPEPNFNDFAISEYEPPKNETEAEIVKIWGSILDVDDIGVLDDYYALGGDSLKSIKIIVEMNKRFGVDVSSRNMLRCKNIRELGSLVDNQDKKEQESIPKVAVSNYYPVSAAQKRQYILNKIDGDINYNLPGSLMIEGRLDLGRLDIVFKTIIDRHESLRTSFEMKDGQPIQIVHDTVDFRVEYLESGEAENGELMASFVKPFDLSAAPLLRVRLVSFSEEKHVLLFDMHHIISDGASINIIAKEITELYNGSELPELKIQYKDYSAWHNALLTSEKIKKQEAYWLDRFSGEIPVLNMPLDFARPSFQSFRGNKLYFTIDRSLTERIRELTAKTGTTLFMFLLSAYNVLLSKYTGQEDIIVGTPVEGRRHADLRDLIGMFVNTLAIRSYPAWDKTFEAFLNEVKEDLLNAYDNQEYPFEELVEKVDIKRDMSRNPLFSTSFVLQNMDLTKLPAIGFTATPYKYDIKTSKFDLTLEVAEKSEMIEYSIEYCTDLFAEETIGRLAGHFNNALHDITENPGKKLSEIDILSDAERRQLLYEFNDTAADYPRNKTIQQIFEEQVDKTPDNTALIFGDRKMTYAELNEKSNRLAHTLRKYGVGPDKIVAVMTYRSIEMMIGIMGILKAGGAYMPIDPDYPAERKKYMLRNSSTGILLAQHSLLDSAEFDGFKIDLDDMADFSPETMNPLRNNSPCDLAYVIYTSGSTGSPKGVMVEHTSVINRLNWMQKQYPLDENSVIMQKTTFTFDVSVWELFWWAFTGASVCLINPGDEKEPEKIICAIEKHGVTTIHFVPSMLSVFLSYMNSKKDTERLKSLRDVFASGEALSLNQVNLFNNLLFDTNGTRLTNLYGPTEATVDVSYFDCSPMPRINDVPIGRPIDNISLYILDDNRNLLPVGVPGELYIGGTGVARGYLLNPDLTSERFVDNPYMTNDILYRTGDRARWYPNGDIVFLGRLDNQVKVRGIRVELGEIENRLAMHPHVKEAVIKAFTDSDSLTWLAAFVITEKQLSTEALRSFLAESLPAHMIPAAFTFLDVMPKTANGKVDRRALLKPEYSTTICVDYVPPADDTEAELVDIWQKILGVVGIGVLDEYTALGGDSLKAIMIVTSIHKKWGIEVSPKDVFHSKNIRELARLTKTTAVTGYLPIPKAPESAWYPASAAQKRIYRESKIDDGTVFNMPLCFFVDGVLECSNLKNAFLTIIKRHESLRTSFAEHDGALVQIIHQDVEFDIEESDSIETDIDKLMTNYIKTFDLTKAPLLRVKLIRLPDKRLLLMMNTHHIISDGASLNIIIDEMVQILRGEDLPELTVQYKDYSVWNNEFLKSDEIQKQEAFWLSRLTGEIPVLNMPIDYPRPEKKSMEGNTLYFTLDEELIGELKSLAALMKTTLYMVLLSCYGVLLSKYTGQQEIIIGINVEGRNHSDLRDVIGVFFNTPIVRCYPVGDKTYKALLSEVKQELLNVYENQDYPFEELVAKLEPRKKPNRGSLLDTLFVMQNIDKIKYVTNDLVFNQYNYHSRRSVVDLCFGAYYYGETITCRIEYCTKLFKADTIERLVSHYESILRQIVRNPSQKLSDIISNTELPIKRGKIRHDKLEPSA
jgi:amino acid adenylation domain-containing protein